MSDAETQASWLPAIAATLLLFLVAMDQVMMPIATSAVVVDLKTNVGMVQAALALVSLVAAPLYITGGKLGDIYGKKRIFILGLILYGIGTLSATLAPSIVVLIGGWSMVRALGNVLAIPASIGLIIASYPDEGQRGRAFAIYGVGGVSAALVGPLLMGVSAEALSWRVPFGLETILAVVTIILARSIPESARTEGAKIDWGGTGLAFMAIASILLGSMLGGRYGWWLARRPFTIGTVEVNPLGLSPAPLLLVFGIIITAILLSRLTRMGERGRAPLFSMRLFDNRTFFTAWTLATVFFILSGALPFIVPVFVQQVVGFDGLQTALTMMALSVGSIIFGFASGSLIQRIQPRTLMQIFLLVTAGGLVWLTLAVSSNVTLVQLLPPMFLLGCGFGVITSQIPNIQLSNLAPGLQGEGSGFAETGKELGIGLGTAVIASIMFSMAIGGFVDNVARAGDFPLTLDERSAVILEIEDEAYPDEALQVVAQRVPNLDQLGKEAYVEAFQATLSLLVGIVLVALLLASLIPKVEVEAVTDPDTREAVADVSSKRL